MPSLQTAVADSALAELDVTVTAIGATGVLNSTIIMHHKGGSTGVATVVGPEIVMATSTGFDMTAAGMKLGISCNPGASGVFTFVQCQMLVFGTV